MPEAATVFIVDDDVAMLKSLSRLLSSAGFRVASYESAKAFRQSYDPARPGCLVLDVCLGRTNGLELQADLVARGICPPLIVISGYAEVPRVVDAMRDGALDFLEKPLDDEVLLSRVREAIDKDATTRRERKQQQELIERVASLSPRQHEVMQMLVSGKTTKEVARGLGISIKTVDCHRASVLEKLGAKDVVELVRLLFNMQHHSH